MTDTDDAAVYRIVCERCEMRTGRMTKSMAEKGQAAHADATGHDVEVVDDG